MVKCRVFNSTTSHDGEIVASVIIHQVGGKCCSCNVDVLIITVYNVLILIYVYLKHVVDRPYMQA